MGPMSFVCPGDCALVTGLVNEALANDVNENEAEVDRKMKLGPGLVRSGECLSPLYSGFLRSTGNTKFWIDFDQKRYFPVAGDSVVGVVVSSHAEHYKVDVGYHVHALLDNLAFEGASKRNRPQLTAGSVVYCRVALANRDIEPEVRCIGEGGKSDGYGELTGGFCCRVRSTFVKSVLFDPNSPFVQALSQQRLTFDMVVGLNRTVWVKGATLEQTHFLVAVILSLQSIRSWHNHPDRTKAVCRAMRDWERLLKAAK